jgi:ABC-type multidrug transport system fused ATPase/permease subunit
VFKINLKFIDQGMSIITEIVSLAIVAGAAFFAVASKLDQSKTEDDIAIIGTSIAFSMQITGIIGGIIWNVADIEGLLSDNVVMAAEIIGKNQEKNYLEPNKPVDWPANGDIDFDRVTLRYPGSSEASIKDIKLHIKSGERIFITGRSGCGKGALSKAVTKYLEPVQNIDRTLGVLKIAGIDIQKIGRCYIAGTVVALNPVPFIYTATLR